MRRASRGFLPPMSLREVAAVKEGCDCVLGCVEDWVCVGGDAFVPPDVVAGGVDMPFASGSGAGEAMVARGVVQLGC